MTNLVGFAGKRNDFRNETIENETISGTKRLKNDAEQYRAKWAHKVKTSVFQIKTFQFCVIARPQCGRGNLKAEGMASRGEAREHEAKRNPYHKNMRFAVSFCCLTLYLWFCFVPRNHSSFRDGKSFRQRLPRRAQKLRPPRNDKSGGFCGKTEQFPERNV